MNASVLPRRPRRTPGWGLLLSALVGWAASLNPQLVQGQTGPSSHPGADRLVNAVSVQSPVTDGSMSWIIEPDVPRIPKVAGLHSQLPPHIERRMSYAFDLAQRGALYTAEAEFRSVLGLCALEVDAREGGTSRRDALRQGFVALDEAEQFSGQHIDWRESADVRSVALGHATTVLREAKSPVDSIQAVQAYYVYAEDRLAYACRGCPSASLAYYGLARTLTVPGSNVVHAAGRAALLQRVALSVAPQNVLAGNELAVLLAQHGQLDEAERILRLCVATDASPETWRNLAVVCARKGDNEASRSAMAAGEKLAENQRQLQLAARAARAAENGQGAPRQGNSEEESDSTGIFGKFDWTRKIPSLIRR